MQAGQKVRWGVMVMVLAALPGASFGQQESDGALAAPKKCAVHSRMFNDYPGIKGKTIPEKIASMEKSNGGPLKSGEIQLRAGPTVTMTWRSETPYSPEDLHPPFRIAEKVCEADAVVYATAGQGTSSLTQDQKFLYTDWSFAVDEVLKNNPAEPIENGATITVTRPGGDLMLGGVHVTATLADFSDFVAGTQYLLFLKFIPETKDYKATEEESFVRSSGRFSHLSAGHYNYSEVETHDTETTLATIKSATQGPANCLQRNN